MQQACVSSVFKLCSILGSKTWFSLPMKRKDMINRINEGLIYRFTQGWMLFILKTTAKKSYNVKLLCIV